MTRATDLVTDHAVVCYLERVYGVDINALKRRICRDTETGRDAGADAVVVHGTRHQLSAEGRVVAITGTSGKVMTKRGKRYRARQDKARG